MLVCATQKVTRNLHLEPSDVSTRPSPHVQQWYANLIRVARVKYYLLTDSVTLISVVFPATGVISVRRFAATTSDVIHDYFVRRAWGRLITTRFDVDPTDVVISRTHDRRVLGSMNDFAWQTELLMREHQLPLEEVIDQLNRCPMSYLGMDSPEFVVERLLGELQ